MSTFSGPYRNREGDIRSPRDMADHRETKRIQAELRAEDVPHDRTRAHRIGKCPC